MNLQFNDKSLYIYSEILDIIKYYVYAMEHNDRTNILHADYKKNIMIHLGININNYVYNKYEYEYDHYYYDQHRCIYDNEDINYGVNMMEYLYNKKCNIEICTEDLLTNNNNENPVMSFYKITVGKNDIIYHPNYTVTNYHRHITAIIYDTKGGKVFISMPHNDDNIKYVVLLDETSVVHISRIAGAIWLVFNAYNVDIHNRYHDRIFHCKDTLFEWSI